MDLKIPALLLGGVVLFIAASSEGKAKAATPKPQPLSPPLPVNCMLPGLSNIPDAGIGGLPEPLRTTAKTVQATGTNPSDLIAFATSLRMCGQTKAADEIEKKAKGLGLKR